MSPNGPVLRILDANINRFCEGCRVIEEFLRFSQSPVQTGDNLRKIRFLRQRMRSAVRRVPGLSEGLLTGRNTGTDPGAGVLYDKKNLSRASLRDVATAGFKRLQESGRVLEEYSKISVPALTGVFKRLRFGAYALEQSVLSRTDSKQKRNRKHH